jgi:hypothetical protein
LLWNHLMCSISNNRQIIQILHFFLQVQSARLAIYFKVHICTSGIVELFIILLITQNKAENLNVSSTQEDSEAQFIVPGWGGKVDYGIGLSYRPVRTHTVGLWAGTYDNPMP